MFNKVLIANRGEIAGRIIRTLRKLGVASVAVYSDADRFTRPALDADEAVRVGPAPVRESYLDVDAIIGACLRTGAEAVHPGYGFLSENADFAERLAANGIAFIGPRPEHLRGFGLKHTAREIARAAGVPLLAGSGLLDSADEAVAAAEQVGFPVMLKSTAGGGGIGMQLCHDATELRQRLETVQRIAGSSFGDARVYLERFVAVARHVEVQIFGDGKGRVVALGERDCSLQRRNQKVVEETPAPNLPETVRSRLHAAAVALGEAVAYESAGTVEFIYDVAREDFSFLEVNTRLQVEHPVTEAVFGVDLVEWMVKQAAGEFMLPAQVELVPCGAAIEARIYAETPQADFRPSTGLLTKVAFPKEVRVDGWIETGSEVTPWYDPMLAKVIVHAEDRPAALSKLKAALADTTLLGIETNLDYLRAIGASDVLAAGEISTAALKTFPFTPRAIEVLAPGAQSSVQDWPGRLGLWHVGVPPSGPMDDRSFRLANRLVGNPEGSAALECAVTGPTLKFHREAVVALTGADMQATLDGAPAPRFAPFAVPAGSTLALGRISGPGQRAYLAVAGAIEAAEAFGSRATFMLGRFGGHATGALRAGDILKIDAIPPEAEPRAAHADERPELTSDWTIGVRSGPHGAPDFFQDADIVDLFGATYEVHFNSDRTGVRLIGPQPRWARPDGGEAGLHPSNIHDNAYAVGSLDFTGDMPIILGPDGPSLGGFVCPVVVAREEMWKTGQLKPGDRVRFVPHGLALPSVRRAQDIPSPILGMSEDGPTRVVYRRAGDDNLLVEYGPMALDVALRMRVHVLAEALAAEKMPGIIELTPGIRSLQVHFDSAVLPVERLLAALRAIESALPPPEDVTVQSSTVWLPLSWNDPQIRLAMRKYQELVRPDAPWCPDNIEFIRRINGLGSTEDVRRIVFDAEYLVLGLGDVYLGAPVATPVDPRHRLVTTKYNPARTWTPENAVGIGGAYLCVYGMEGPGGYQLFGRTIQMWNSWRVTKAFRPEHPYLLRFFDRVRFFPVDEQELLEMREAFPHGRYDVRIEDSQFSYRDYARLLAEKSDSIGAFQHSRQAAFEAERADWKARGLDSFVSDSGSASTADEEAVPEGCTAAPSHMTGNVWKLLVAEGDEVAAGQPIVVVEAMKMEMEISAPVAGRIVSLRARQGRTVRAGDVVAVIAGA
ncbi:5-oxoprolinase/urea amidolyase family protein [Hansschlegelia sp.]|uniref:5-oxoprolinase/urea amidolyase family protein n=1 Tax=Hansschlegelia sp. TaxID=2041892 RepID=UPI002BFD0DAD|nr:5-oxoprolinase/urea amidolyase family protein [Hansschlegelia sp.]HVI29283.1 5-oxoprolinase/urea amidolyase family protein [Hansschlegelia sp.]